MSATDESIRTLLNRLYWPIPDVASASCEEIAALLASPETSQTMADAIVSSLAQQESEYRVAVGLLPVVYARDVFGTELGRLPSLGRLISAIHRPSPLASSYLRTLGASDWLLETQTPQFMTIDGVHSAVDDDSFRVMDEHGAPQSFLQMVQRLSESTHIDCMEHMHGEYCSLMRDPENRDLDLDPDITWDHNREYVPIVTRTVEVYMSAYLRTLSWLIYRRVLTNREGEKRAAIASPAILGYWRTKAVSVPSWWPWLGNIGDAEAANQVRRAIEVLGEGDHGLAGESPILEASGRVASGDCVTDLDILSYLTDGAETPEESTWGADFEWLEGKTAVAPLGTHLPLTMPASESMPTSYMVQGATLCAASTSLHLRLWGSWHWASLVRGLHAPSEWLSTGGVAISCKDFEVAYDCGDSRHASLIRWNSGLRSTCTLLDAHDFHGLGFVMPSNGTALLGTKHTLDTVREQTGMHLAWLCRVRCYSQKDGYGSYEVVDSFFPVVP